MDTIYHHGQGIGKPKKAARPVGAAREIRLPVRRKWCYEK
jgi:hypothetical protein